MGITRYPHGIQATPLIGAGAGSDTFASGNIWFVNGSASSSGDGKSPQTPFTTIQAAVDAASEGGVIYIAPKTIPSGATDPVGYAESVIVGNSKPKLSLIGIQTGRAMGGQPMLRQGAGTAAHIILRAPGCTVKNLTINGASNSGGGILIDESATGYVAFGTTIEGCYFKNCRGSAAASTGGAIAWSSNGGGWQTLIQDCIFSNCRAGIVVPGTSASVPESLVIRYCEFLASVNTTTDADIYIAASGVISLNIHDCVFGTVDVPAYASSPDAARYIYLAAGNKGVIANSYLACTGKTIGAAGDAAIVPTTVRVASIYQESGLTGRT
jgi:hypothetical protein